MRIVKLIGGGRGLGHADGRTWMVRGSLPDELVLAHPVRRRAGIVEAETVEVSADPHAARLDTPCPRSGSCGGCDWPHVDPNLGATLKRSVAVEAAARFPVVSQSLAAAPVTPSPPAYRLRNRLHWDPDSRTLGFYAHRSWDIVDISPCRIVTERLRAALPVLVDALAASCRRRVDLETLEGDDALIIGLRPARGGPRDIPEHAVPERRRCRGIDGFHRLDRALQLQPSWGPQSVMMELPIPLDVPLGSFFQGNRHLVPRLFDRVAGLVGVGDEPVVDLHGGVGFLAAAAHSTSRLDLTVVEPNPVAAAAAERNLPAATVTTGTAEAYLNDNELPPGAVVITDPPRCGLSNELRETLGRRSLGRLVMLGCDPATWSRDAAALIDTGAAITHIELVDLFPHTHHVEVLAVLDWQ